MTSSSCGVDLGRRAGIEDELVEESMGSGCAQRVLCETEVEG
jgi:hypothetical protein